MARPSLAAVAVLLLGALATACSDSAPTAPLANAGIVFDQTGEGLFHRYVAIGTSVSMGVTSDGVYAASQRSSWPAQLARLGGRELTVPAISFPGCGAPLLAPVASGLRISGESASLPADLRSCAPNEEGVTLPARNVAVDGATTWDAVFATPATYGNTHRGRQHSRVLPAGATQVSAMLAQNPKIVSVELGANELLQARTGVYLPGENVVTTAAWKPLYVQVVDAVASTAKHAVLIGLVDDAHVFPGFRSGQEIWDARGTIAPLGVIVAPDCGTANSANVMFVGVRIPVAAATARATGAPVTLSCANAPSFTKIQDYVLSAAEVVALNAQLAEMNAFIREQAELRGFAYAELGSLYARSDAKPPLNGVSLMTSPLPYGPYIGLDGFHPNGEGARIIADAAAAALNDTYRFEIPLSTGPSAILAVR